MELIVNKVAFKKFVNLITLSGQHQNKEALFLVQKTGITTLLKSPTNAVGIKATLKGEYTEIGELGIDDLPLFMNSLDILAGDTAKIAVKQNKISIASGKTRASLMLRKSDYIKNNVTEEAFKQLLVKASGNEFTFGSEEIASVLQAYNLIKSPSVKLTGKDKTLTLSFSKNENIIDTDIPISKSVETFEATVDSFIISLLNSINGKVTMSAKQGTPILLLQYEVPEMTITYLIAPMVK